MGGTRKKVLLLVGNLDYVTVGNSCAGGIAPKGSRDLQHRVGKISEPGTRSQLTVVSAVRANSREGTLTSARNPSVEVELSGKMNDKGLNASCGVGTLLVVHIRHVETRASALKTKRNLSFGGVQATRYWSSLGT